MWFFFAILSAVFAALTSILAKVGIDGVGDGFLSSCTERNFTDQQQKLAFLNPVRFGNWCILAVLLQSITDWRDIKSSTGR